MEVFLKKKKATIWSCTIQKFTKKKQKFFEYRKKYYKMRKNALL